MALLRTEGCAMIAIGDPVGLGFAPAYIAWEAPKCLAACDPAAGLDAEDAEVDGIAFRGDDAVFGDDAVLLAAGDDFAGQQ